MDSYSIFRGQDRTGIGEAKGVPVLSGEQYLAADRELWHDAPPDLPAKALAWMTLDAREKEQFALGDEIEAWSYFGYDQPEERHCYRFVVRMIANGQYNG